RKFSGRQCRLVKLQRPPPEIRIFLPVRSARSSTTTRRPRLPASMAHISPAAPAPSMMTSKSCRMRRKTAYHGGHRGPPRSPTLPGETPLKRGGTEEAEVGQILFILALSSAHSVRLVKTESCDHPAYKGDFRRQNGGRGVSRAFLPSIFPPLPP